MINSVTLSLSSSSSIKQPTCCFVDGSVPTEEVRKIWVIVVVLVRVGQGMGGGGGGGGQGRGCWGGWGGGGAFS